MSIETMTWAFNQPLSGNEKVVLLALADFSNDDGECWPSIPSIAKKAHLSVRTVQRIIISLSDQGYMAFERRSSINGGPVVSKYRLFVDGDNLTPGGDKMGGGGDTVVVSIDEPLLRTVTKYINRGGRVPNQFTPDDTCHQVAKKLDVTITADLVDSFVDYWKGVSGAKGVKLDWQATFRNQLRHAAKFKTGAKYGKRTERKSLADITAERLAEIESAQAGEF